MLHELRTFCEDNNFRPPGPLEEVPARPELTFVRVGDPALEIEAEPAVRIASGSRVVFIQRVFYEIRFLLQESNEVFEFGDVPGGDPSDEVALHTCVTTMFGMAGVFLAGGGIEELRPFRRRSWV